MPDRTKDLARAFQQAVIDNAYGGDVLAKAIEQSALTNLAQLVIIRALVADLDTNDEGLMQRLALTIANATELAQTHALISPLNDWQIATLPSRVLQSVPEPIKHYLADILHG